MTPRRAGFILVIGLILASALLPFDQAIARFCLRFGNTGDLRLGGDLRRTLEYLQQFGDLAWSLLIGITILLLDPPMAKRFPGWIAAAASTSIVVFGIKILVGRPRPGIVLSPDALPGYQSSWNFMGPVGKYPLPRVDQGVVQHVWAHSWEFGKGISADLWSMPSSHSSAAAALAIVLVRMYPRLTPLVLGLCVVTASARVVLSAHYPSDTVVGLTIGWVVSGLVMDSSWAGRLAGRGGGATSCDDNAEIRGSGA